MEKKKDKEVGGYFDEEKGFRYHVHKKYKNGELSLRCTRYNHKYDCCKGSATLKEDGTFDSKIPHNHPGNPTELEEIKMKKNIRHIVEICPNVTNLKDMVDKVRSKDPEVGKNISYASIDSQLFNIKAKHNQVRYMGKVKTLETLHEKIKAKLVKYEYGKKTYFFESELVEITEKIKHLLLVDPDFVARFIGLEFFLEADGTHTIIDCIYGVEQLLIVFAIYKEHAYPIAWAFMMDKTEVSYNGVLGRVKSRFPDLIPRYGITDWERALMNAVMICFILFVYGCYFHFTKAVLKNAKRHHVALAKHNKRDNPIQHKLIRKFMAIPKLLEMIMPRGFELVKAECAQKFPNGQFNNFIAYFDHTWMKNTDHEKLCVYRRDHRTSNHAELQNRSLKRGMLESPDTNTLLNKISECALKKRLEFENPPERRRRSKALRAEQELNLAWDRLDAAGYTDESIMKFLDEVTHFDGEVIDDDDDDEEEDGEGADEEKQGEVFGVF